MSFNNLRYLKKLGLGELYDESGEKVVKVLEAAASSGSYAAYHRAGAGQKADAKLTAKRALELVDFGVMKELDESDELIRERTSRMEPVVQYCRNHAAAIEYLRTPGSGQWHRISVMLMGGFALDDVIYTELATYGTGKSKRTREKTRSVREIGGKTISQRKIDGIIRKYDLAWDGRTLIDNVLHCNYRTRAGANGRKPSSTVKIDLQYVNDDLEQWSKVNGGNLRKDGGCKF